MTVPNLIGRDVRISLADFAGEFHELGSVILSRRSRTSPPDQRDQVLVIDGQAGPILAQIGQRGDRLIIDDPWASEWPALKDEEMRRIDMREKISSRDFEREQAGPGNRKARRAAEAKARRAR